MCYDDSGYEIRTDRFDEHQAPTLASALPGELGELSAFLCKIATIDLGGHVVKRDRRHDMACSLCTVQQAIASSLTFGVVRLRYLCLCHNVSPSKSNGLIPTVSSFRSRIFQSRQA